MKEIRGMKRGVKLEAQPNNSQRIATMDKELKNIQMAGRVSQMMLQQVMNNLQSMSKDLGKAFGTINELQYKIIAMQTVGNFDMDAMAKKAEELRLNDFVEASDAEDIKGNFTIGTVAKEDSTIVITSTTAGTDAGIFRSRIKLAECGVSALIQGFMGQAPGTKVNCQLNGVQHEVELLAIRNPPPAVLVEAVPPSGEVVQVGESRTLPDGSEQSDFIRVPESETVH